MLGGGLGHGPCCHCGTTLTPCWRKGPAEKPVLCNACGARYLVKNSLDGYFPGTKGGHKSGLKLDGVAKPRASKPKVFGLKRKGPDGNGLLAAAAVQHLAWNPALVGAPAFFWPAPAAFAYSTALDAAMASGSSDSESMEQPACRGKDDSSSIDSQEAPGARFSSAVAAVAGLLAQQQQQQQQHAAQPAQRSAPPPKLCVSRIRPRKQTHPTMCC